MSPERRLLQTHPHWPEAATVLNALNAAGHKAYLAGGSVRDALRGVVAQDLDIATSASPDRVAALFDKTVDVGKSFGVIRVILGAADLEVATFRGDGEYVDGRRPESVHFSDEREDALRRDFTVNALFFDPRSDAIIDHVGGLEDLKTKTIRTVGDPAERFREDHLRLLRAVRFAVQLDFAIESATWDAVRAKAGDVKTVSRERVRDEIGKMFRAGGGGKGPRLLEESGLLTALFPSLAGFEETLRVSAARRLARPSPTLTEALTRWLVPLAESGPAGTKAAHDVLSSLRLGKDDERFVRRALETLGDLEGFWARPLGKKLLAYGEPAVRLAAEMGDEGGPDPRHEELRREFAKIAPRGELPEKILRGDDLLPRVQGAALGEILAAAYEAQLEGRFADKAGALTWADEWTRLKRA